MFKFLLYNTNTFLNFLKLISTELFYKNVSIGNNVRIDINTQIVNNNGKINIGNNVFLRSSKNGYHAAMPFPTTLLVDINGASIIIGDNCRLNGVFMHSQSEIRIGSNCVFASGVQIIDSNGHEILSSDRTRGRDIPKPILIGNNVWIGINAIILKGSEIGDNSVVSAGSVVKGKFAANSLIVGNPAIEVKKLEIHT